jgi:hypothetical protein
LHQYYRGITQQLRSEVDFINSLFHHQGVKGEGNEAVLRDLIKKFIPKRYGIGTGVLIDRFGHQSRQCDIVVYDTLLYPSLLSLSSVHLFPVDLVYATIEVKTTLDSGTVKEALQNIASVKALDYIKADFATFTTRNGAGLGEIQKTTPPAGFVFAYNSEARTDDTFKTWFTPEKPEDTPQYPSLVGCLDFGIIGFVSPGVEDCSASSLPDVGMSPSCMCFPVVQPKDISPHEVQIPDQVQFLKVSRPPQDGEFVEFAGSICPVKKVGKDYMAIDQGRVLLNFLLLFNELLSLKTINPSIKFTESYLHGVDRFHFVHTG